MGGIRHKSRVSHKPRRTRRAGIPPLRLKQAYFRMLMRPCFIALVSKFTYKSLKG